MTEGYIVEKKFQTRTAGVCHLSYGRGRICAAQHAIWEFGLEDAW